MWIWSVFDYVCLVASMTFVEKAIFPLLDCNFIKSQWVYFCVSNFFPPVIHMAVSIPITYMLDYLTIQSLKFCRMIPTTLYFFKIVLAILISLLFCIHFIIILSMRNFAEILTQIVLNLFINLGRVDTLSSWVSQSINTI